MLFAASANALRRWPSNWNNQKFWNMLDFFFLVGYEHQVRSVFRQLEPFLDWYQYSHIFKGAEQTYLK